jgi:UDP-N-acetyl-2-amino-2-deoxyglucuronate dehydrogenase
LDGSTQNGPTTIEDFLGVFEPTTATRPSDLEASLSILGEHGTVILGGNAVNRIAHRQFDVETEEDDRIRAQASQEVPNVYGHGHVNDPHRTARPGGR